ncbi:hypothetical protein NQ315_017557 [Exocentrus adspersus]|uniref:DDE Tnp4 domain-containing protein n=1 Tax=Exocentrus adspersus TaxID=1586481 RepID=A0AAV8VIM5_9CUCU|nr:hypothetical protein NQ315_017557 [Exocentrus adspersus]
MIGVSPAGLITFLSRGYGGRASDKAIFEQKAKINALIAKARVHIERVNQKIKVFKILNSTVDWSLVGILDHIMLVVCAICNLFSPILSDEEF